MFDWITQRYKQTPDTLDNGDNILWLLTGLSESKTPLDVKLAHSFAPYQSRILSINPALGCMLLDELTPVEGHAHIKPGKTLHIKVDNAQGSIAFSVLIKAINQQASGYSYRIDLPAQIDFQAHQANPEDTKEGQALTTETRAHPRVKPDSDFPVGLQRFFDGTHNLNARIENLSLSGLGLSLDHKPDLESGDRIENVSVTLPDGKRIEGDLEVRHIQHESDGTTVGAEFVDLDDNQTSTLAAVVAQLSSKS